MAKIFKAPEEIRIKLMRLVVISDIFGRTKALEKLCTKLKSRTEIIDPYTGQDMGFDSEKDAYDYFMHHVRLEDYTLKIKKMLERKDGRVGILAFSVGAACVWKLSAFPLECRVEKAFCFYGKAALHEPAPRIRRKNSYSRSYSYACSPLSKSMSKSKSMIHTSGPLRQRRHIQ